jgi:predicted HAD superfamily Cof-like phosphohydrolase
MLTQEELKKHLHYEPSTGVFTWRSPTSFRVKVDQVAGWDTHGHTGIRILGTSYLAHRLAWLYQTGEWPTAQIDHINGNRKDNKFLNLRQATNTENNINKDLTIRNNSGYKGVSWVKTKQKWLATCCIRGVQNFIGYFDNKYDAAEAYAEFAKTNQGAFYKEPNKTMLTDIRDFHVKFGLEYSGPPRLLDKEDARFRIKLMHEELAEYKKAEAENDLAGSLDALVDLIYVALGTAYRQGLPFKEGWGIVQTCNMTKVRALPDGSNSKRGSAFDIAKPEGWVAPNYSEILP